MKTKFLSNGYGAIVNLFEAIIFTAFDIALPRIEFFKSAFDVAFFCKIFTVVVILAWGVVLFMPYKGVSTFAEINEQGINIKWFKKTIDFTSWNEIADASKIFPFKIALKKADGKTMIFGLNKNFKTAVLAFCTNEKIADKIKSF